MYLHLHIFYLHIPLIVSQFSCHHHQPVRAGLFLQCLKCVLSALSSQTQVALLSPSPIPYVSSLYD